MQEVKIIISEIDDDNKGNCHSFFIIALNSLLILIIAFILCLYILYFTSISLFDFLKENNHIDLTKFIQYVKDCNNSINYDRDKIYNMNPYISVCIPVYNMENYIEKNLLSIINQSFQDFEIIIVNDASEDNTENIIKRFQTNDKRIKLLSHSKKLGTYHSRIDAIYNSKSKYTLLMDPDDMYLNENLFKKLYDYNIKYNLDITEFLVLQQIEGNNEIFFSKSQFGNHSHNFDKNIIYQPELSNLLYHFPNSNEYSRTICRNIWNKMIRNDIFIKASKYIGNDYYNEYMIIGDDMLMNIATYQFANNFSNIKLPGYLYILRKVSVSHGRSDELKEIRAKNFIFYFQKFFKYIKDYQKDINILYNEMKNLNRQLSTIKRNNMTEFKSIILDLFNNILNEKNISINLFIKNFTRKNYNFYILAFDFHLIKG